MSSPLGWGSGVKTNLEVKSDNDKVVDAMIAGKKIKKEIVATGRKLLELGVIGSHSGNISTIFNDHIFVTRTGSSLGYLSENDIVTFPLSAPQIPAQASVETIVHLAIYKHTDANIIVHSHPPSVISLSLVTDKIIPVDAEGRYYLPEIPIFEAKNPIGSEEVAEIAAQEMQRYKVIVIKSHGIFVKGKSWDEVINLTSVTEKSSKIIINVERLKSLQEK